MLIRGSEAASGALKWLISSEKKAVLGVRYRVEVIEGPVPCVQVLVSIFFYSDSTADIQASFLAVPLTQSNVAFERCRRYFTQLSSYGLSACS